MREYSENDLLDLELKYKNDPTVLDLIEIIRDFIMQSEEREEELWF